MRVLYVCLDRGISVGDVKGAAIHVSELLRALEAEGHVTAVVARSSTSAAIPSMFLAAGARVPDWVPGRVLFRDLNELRLRSRFREAVRNAIVRFRPDAVLERYALFRDEGVFEARRAGLPVALEVNAPLAWEERRFRGLALAREAARTEQQAWRGADVVIVPSRPLATRVRAAGQPRVLVVPNAVDPERFSAAGDPSVPRHTLGLDERFVVGFAGSLKPWHDLATVVDAVAALPAAARGALLLVGDGPERTVLQRRAAARGVLTRFTGPVPHAQVGQYLAVMDACVAPLPADPELDYFAPLKALEYLAAGRPTVVARSGDLAALAEAGVALAYTPGSAQDLAAQLTLVARDRSRRAQLEQAGPAYARTRTWRQAARTIAQALDRLRSTSATA